MQQLKPKVVSKAARQELKSDFGSEMNFRMPTVCAAEHLKKTYNMLRVDDISCFL